MPKRTHEEDVPKRRPEDKPSNEARGRPGDGERVDTGVDVPDAEDSSVDALTRDEVERDPGEATRKLPKNDQAL